MPLRRKGHRRPGTVRRPVSALFVAAVVISAPKAKRHCTRIAQTRLLVQVSAPSSSPGSRKGCTHSLFARQCDTESPPGGRGRLLRRCPMLSTVPGPSQARHLSMPRAAGGQSDRADGAGARSAGCAVQGACCFTSPSRSSSPSPSSSTLPLCQRHCPIALQSTQSLALHWGRRRK